MTRWIAVLRALPLTFVVYVVEACGALLIGTPLLLELARHTKEGLSSPLGRAAWLESAREMVPVARVSGLQAAMVIGLLLLLSPWLQMAWLSAISQPMAAGRALSSGARHWLRAMLTSLCVWLGSALMAAPFVLTAWALHRWLAPFPNARAHDLAVVLALAPLVLVFWVHHTWHDLARARCLGQGAFRSAAKALPRAFSPSVLAQSLLWSLSGLSLVLLAQLAFAHQGNAWLGSAGATVIIQLTTFLRLVSRSRWLATALVCAEEADAPSASLRK